ncbi:MAG TPA: ATP-binding cassette domain-containing protein [Candidatus Limnocylindrales bacterium]|nr:ATP-binding cassette domain-containing protein [Candidatus Limnocylindrales bacterium]
MSTLRVEIAKAFSTGNRVNFSLKVDFEAQHGVTVIFGPSGSGKTTLLQCVAGLVQPDRGSIAMGNCTFLDTAKNINVAPQGRRTGYVFQDLALFPHMSAADNVEFALRGNERDRKDKVARLLERFRLTGVASRRPRELSGGERQRVALARAFAIKPRLLLLDEPFSALDDELKMQIIQDLKSWIAEERIPALFVTHDREEARALGERVLTVHEGQITGEERPIVSAMS